MTPPLLLAVPELAVAELDVVAPPPDELLLELLLLPHPAKTNKPMTVMAARLRRTRAEWWYISTVSSP